jgi:hypothetical protein
MDFLKQSNNDDKKLAPTVFKNADENLSSE